MNSFNCIEFTNGKLKLIDQTKLPLQEAYIISSDYERIAKAIEKLEVRGAPAIGVSAAYAIALSFKNFTGDVKDRFDLVFERLASTRPTAVNLFWALNEMENKFENLEDHSNVFEELLDEAKRIHKDDIDKCDNIAKNGLEIFKEGSVVLTHCNTGQLATGGGGTAFYVIKNAFKNKLVEFVYADETRPLLQGSRLTAFELDKAGIPFKVITDSTAAFLMKQKKVDLVITGADRIAKNGDSANKIGTYNLAVNCKYHNVPFYVAAPTSTIDFNCSNGDDIIIEERHRDEVASIKDVKIMKDNYKVYSPAFDVTPNELISGIITEEKLYKPPYDFNV